MSERAFICRIARSSCRDRPGRAGDRDFAQLSSLRFNKHRDAAFHVCDQSWNFHITIKRGSVVTQAFPRAWRRIFHTRSPFYCVSSIPETELEPPPHHLRFLMLHNITQHSRGTTHTAHGGTTLRVTNASACPGPPLLTSEHDVKQTFTEPSLKSHPPTWLYNNPHPWTRSNTAGQRSSNGTSPRWAASRWTRT